ncbi:GAF domain-containing protein [Gorillibacterium massiliense]|uniref:GAF domain-containing protein n=1 Tax=Gorillibacterium massiliense TaxID=1280390 RepID=UPI0004AEBB20|nr:GAF domain-containing protein [Gorillibacterium massiliense]
MTNRNGDAGTLQQMIQKEMAELKSELKLDFVAVALTDGEYRDIHWRFALGANSDRYKKITVRIGKGMAGKVLQAKSPYVVTAFPEEVQEEMLEYPIFLVESLRSGVGVSVDSFKPERSQAYGVLLIGQREMREFTEKEIERVQICARELGRLYDLDDDDEPAAIKGAENGCNPETGSDVSRGDEAAAGRRSESRSFVAAVDTSRREDGPVLKLLREARFAGVDCELLDQRVTRLATARQQELAAVLAQLVQAGMPPANHPRLVIGQDEDGQTLIEFAADELMAPSQQLFQPVMSQLKSLKCDLEIGLAEDGHYVRFTLPTRSLLDEPLWQL